MRLSLTEFYGMVPKVAKGKLAEKYATEARNCMFGSGNLSPLAGKTQIKTLTGAPGSIFRMGRAQANEALYWLQWSAKGVKAVYGQIAGDTSERMYYTGDGVPKVTNLLLATNGATVFPNISYRLGIPAPASAPAVAVSNPNGSIEPASDRFYVITYVSAWGEEGKPSAPSAIVAVKPGGSVTLSGMPGAPTGAYQITSKRIYRSHESDGETDVLGFVAEIPVAQASYVDSLADSQLGEEIATIHYDMPPDTLAGLIELPNGIMAGFTGNDVHFCEPFVPYAWPNKYRLATTSPVVALAPFGQSIAVLTRGHPYLITGIDPAGMSMEMLDLPQSCISAASVVSVGIGVLYASPDGLAYVGQGGARVVTEPIMSQKNWQDLKPETLQGFWFDNRYVGIVDLGTKKEGIILSGLFSGEPSLSYFDTTATAGCVDLERDALYLLEGQNVVRFSSDYNNMLATTWRSKEYGTQGIPPFPFLRVLSAQYPVTVKLIEDKTRESTVSVTSANPQRTPLGLSDRLEIVVTGAAYDVEAVDLFHTIKDLTQG